MYTLHYVYTLEQITLSLPKAMDMGKGKMRDVNIESVITVRVDEQSWMHK